MSWRYFYEALRLLLMLALAFSLGAYFNVPDLVYIVVVVLVCVLHDRTIIGRRR
jgi:hypothetical protein